MPRGNACSRVNRMRQVRRSRSATKARANSIASTGDSLAGPQFAISRPCETAKSWRSLPLNSSGALGRTFLVHSWCTIAPLLRNPAGVHHCSQNAGANVDFGDEGAVDWAFLGNLQQLGAL